MIVSYTQATAGELHRRHKMLIELINSHLAAWHSLRAQGRQREAEKHKEYLETVVYVLGRNVYESLTGCELDLDAHYTQRRG